MSLAYYGTAPLFGLMCLVALIVAIYDWRNDSRRKGG